MSRVKPGGGGRPPGPDPVPDTATLLRAIHFAAEKHRDHRRKGATAAPYINHPIAVAEQLATAGHGQDAGLLMAAVLHDVIEDTETSEEELRDAFGERVARIVMEVTDDKSLPRHERKALVVRNIGHKSREARLVKLSDLLSNVGDVIHHPPNWNRERKQEYLEWCNQVFAGLRNVDAGLEAALAARLAEAARGIG
ncbi:MAG: HD domain-containing protein [Deltaproteobacteria bacterium]|nr:HD domain-containing protein [Deltaproteobacteria bacterium]